MTYQNWWCLLSLSPYSGYCDSKNFLLSQFTGWCAQPGTKAFLMLLSYSTNPHIDQVLAISSADVKRNSLSSKLKHSISLWFDYYNPFLFYWLILHSWHLHKFSQNFAEIILLFVTDFFLIIHYWLFITYSQRFLLFITDFFFNLHVAFSFSHIRCFPLKRKTNVTIQHYRHSQNAWTHHGINPWGRCSVRPHNYKQGRTDWEFSEGLQ